MISRGSEIIVDWLVRSEAIKQEDYDLYYYASYSLILTIFPIGMAFIVGGIMGVTINALLLILPFVVIRKYSGGYHAKSSKMCMFFSVVILVIFTRLSSLVIWNSYFKLVVLVAIISLSIVSPIDSINKKLTLDEKRKYKKITMCLLGLLLLLIFVFDRLHMQQTAVCVSLGIILSASLQIPCLIVKILEKNQN